MSDKLTQLEDKKSVLDDQQKEITNRLNEFESPIGKLKIGFDDLMIIFPIALTGGFAMCASMFVDTQSYRRYYLNFHPKRIDVDGIARNLSDDEISLSAPLWLDPKNDKQNKVVRALVLFIPMAVYLASVALIFYSWSIPQSSLGCGSRDYRPYYTIAYISISVIFVYSYVKIICEYSL